MAKTKSDPADAPDTSNTEEQQSGTTLSGGDTSSGDQAEKVRVASEANVDNDKFHSGDPASSGRGAVLGAQVRPETQLDEASGNRFLAKPRTDPGPVMREDGPNVKHPNILDGHRTIREANPQQFTTTMRTTTAPDHFSRGNNTSQVEMAPDLLYGSAASDMYHPEGRENASLTQRAQERALEGREVAKQND